MKKIIAISVMFALFAGAVFAETSISGNVEPRMRLINGSTAKVVVAGEETSTKPKMGASSVPPASLGLSGSNDDGTFSGKFKIKFDELYAYGDGSSQGAVGISQAFVNWTPMPQLKIFLGIDQDGKFGTDALEGWAYHKGSEDYINFHNWGFWRTVFPGNWDAFGLAFSIYPTDGLEVNLAIPTGATGWRQNTSTNINKQWRLDEMFIAGLRLNVNYAIPDVGKLMITYIGANQLEQGNYNNNNPDKSKPSTNGQFGASFLLTMVEGFQIHVGGSIVLFNTANLPDGAPDKSPIYAGFGVQYAGDGFGVNARGAFVMNGNNGNTDGDGIQEGQGNDNLGDKNASAFNFHIMPWYALEKLTVFFDIGAYMSMYKDADTLTVFFVNPYITVPMGSGKIQAGLRIRSVPKVGTADSYTTYQLPILFSFNF
jgi:hypothetical protein